MTEHGAQYDHIGSKYDEYARTATLKQAESYTFFRMVGPLGRKSVMDLACGCGFYTRMLKQHGAAQVVGVDISPEMVRLATQQEQAEPLGITYQARDAATLSQIGPFDLVTAVYLLNYAASKDQLLSIFRSTYANLVADGRFVAYTVNPDFTLSKPNCTKYGITVRRETPEDGRYVCEAEFITDPPTLFSYYRWSQPPMSGRSKLPDSVTLPGTPRRWHRKTLRAMEKRIGAFSRELPGHRVDLPEMTRDRVARMRRRPSLVYKRSGHSSGVRIQASGSRRQRRKPSTTPAGTCSHKAPMSAPAALSPTDATRGHI